MHLVGPCHTTRSAGQGHVDGLGATVMATAPNSTGGAILGHSDRAGDPGAVHERQIVRHWRPPWRWLALRCSFSATRRPSAARGSGVVTTLTQSPTLLGPTGCFVGSGVDEALRVSSLRVRGRIRRRDRFRRVAGLIPARAGMTRDGVPTSGNSRVIPARAGNGIAQNSTATMRGSHPCASGERNSSELDRNDEGESSLRERGTE